MLESVRRSLTNRLGLSSASNETNERSTNLRNPTAAGERIDVSIVLVTVTGERRYMLGSRAMPGSVCRLLPL